MPTATRLSVNVNKVATLRNTRDIGIPSVVHAAELCLQAGADGITVHPRPDQRHIRPPDVRELAALLNRYPQAEFNIEGNPFHHYMPIVREIKPAQCTLVPDETSAPTSDHGWALAPNRDRLQPIVDELNQIGCRVSLFMDPDPDAMELARELGVQRVELYTAPYAHAFSQGRGRDAVRPYAEAARRATELGLGVNAGHDLNLENLGLFLEEVPGVAEVSIGHALIADALEYGLAETVRRYLAIVRSAPDRG